MQGAGPGDIVRYERNQGRKNNPMFVLRAPHGPCMPVSPENTG